MNQPSCLRSTAAAREDHLKWAAIKPLRPTRLPEELEREEGDRHRREARADRLRELRLVRSRGHAAGEQPREGWPGEGYPDGEQQALDRGRVARGGARGRSAS